MMSASCRRLVSGGDEHAAEKLRRVAKKLDTSVPSIENADAARRLRLAPR
jgi:hypothetical protein